VRLLSSLCIVLFLPAGLRAQEPLDASSFTVAEKENFLLKAGIIKETELPAGIRLGLDDGKWQHEAQAQILGGGRPEEDIRLNLAAYELDKALHLNFIPPTVERIVRGRPAIVSWWVDDLAMDERTRSRRKVEPPDEDRWNKQLQAVRVFDELISNAFRDVDLYLPTLWDNLLITNDWRIWIIDYKQSFRSNKQLSHPETLTQCDRSLLGTLRALNKETLRKLLGKYISSEQLTALDARRDLLVKHFDEQIAQKGQEATLYDLPPGR
jgi:hypothetical protein